MKPSDLKKTLVFAIKNTFPILITGIPGIGKSDIVEQACSEAESDLIISHPVVSDPTDYKGLPFMNAQGEAHFMPFGELTALIKATKPTVFFLDDLGQAPQSVQAACMQLILARRINGHKISDQVTFIAATNRKEDKAGVSGILEPVKSRFASIVELEVNNDDWTKWAIDNDMPIELISFIRFRPNLLSDFKPSKDMKNSPSPRTLAKVGKMQNAGMQKEFEFELIKGAIGEGAAAEYMAFLKIFRELPNIDEIVLNPKGAKVSEEPAVQYAISGAIAHRMNEQNMSALVTYMQRLPAEISVVAMKAAITRKRDLAFNKAYIDWSIKYGNVLS